MTIVIENINQMERTLGLSLPSHMARLPLLTFPSVIDPLFSASCGSLPQGHETSAHRADSDGSVLLPQTPAVHGLRRSPQARTAAVSDYRGDGGQFLRYGVGEKSSSCLTGPLQENRHLYPVVLLLRIALDRRVQ